MIKYTYGLVACLMISSTIFGMPLGENIGKQTVLPQQEKNRDALLKEETMYYAAEVLLAKNKGRNVASLKAAENQREVIDDTRDYIQDRLENRDGNQ